jgi:hypothetical protein
VGLGPNGIPLLGRLGKAFDMTQDYVEMEQNERTYLRKAAQIAHGKANPTPTKPLAPATPDPKVKGQPRSWTWTGETIESKYLVQGLHYSGDEIRKAGFKLPTIGGKNGKEKVQDGGSIAPVLDLVDQEDVCEELHESGS